MRPAIENRQSRADFAWGVYPNGGIYIVDQDRGNVSVTNDVRAVLADIRTFIGEPLHGRRIVYRDSQGRIDRIVVNEADEFVSFEAGIEL